MTRDSSSDFNRTFCPSRKWFPLMLYAPYCNNALKYASFHHLLDKISCIPPPLLNLYAFSSPANALLRIQLAASRRFDSAAWSGVWTAPNIAWDTRFIASWKVNQPSGTKSFIAPCKGPQTDRRAAVSRLSERPPRRSSKISSGFHLPDRQHFSRLAAHSSRDRARNRGRRGLYRIGCEWHSVASFALVCAPASCR